MAVEIFGWIATCTASLYFLPQILKIIITKKTDSLSIWFACSAMFNNSMWITYGSLIGNAQLIVTNICILMCTTTMVVYKSYNIHKGNDEFHWPLAKAKKKDL